ncbi:MAG: Smr/MutS family protein [Gammaproteobacteria bacterium]|nr:Smr/MutS family protein [Gammaproteobacteria bacterium]
MAKKPLNDADRALFRQAVAGTRPLPQDRIKPSKRRVTPIPKQRQRDDHQVLHASLSDPLDPDLQTGDELIFARDGVQPILLRKLRRGQLRIDAELDLHRLNREQARTAISGFLTECVALQQRCVRIIHGKGLSSFNKHPVLKGLVNHWLQQRDEVLGFCSARPNDGGTGALYVLLRRRKTP